MRIAELMTKTVETIAPTATVAAAAKQMRHQRTRHLVVTDGRAIVGLISDRDIGRGAGVHPDDTVAETIARPIITIRPTATARQAALAMRRYRISCLPVVEHGRLLGMLNIFDLLAPLARRPDRPKRRRVDEAL